MPGLKKAGRIIETPIQRGALQTQKLSADTNQTQTEMVVKIPVKIKMPVR